MSLRSQRRAGGKNQIEELFGDFEAQHAAERERLQAMVRYCEVLDCRTQFLREYFGEPRGSVCEHCDNCRQPVRVIETAA
jgi:superfamily II DNA helicase RecQ